LILFFFFQILTNFAEIVHYHNIIRHRTVRFLTNIFIANRKNILYGSIWFPCTFWRKRIHIENRIKRIMTKIRIIQSILNFFISPYINNYFCFLLAKYIFFYLLNNSEIKYICLLPLRSNLNETSLLNFR
jgi:hypothetical protein